jgi:succinate-semialdehyde dehydrogenase / glutarate-semialdehyde dehydrogenase
MSIASVNPSTGETLREFQAHGSDEVERRLALAARTVEPWRRTPVSERAKLLVRVAELLEQDKAEFGRLMALEMGKPIGAGMAEAEKCASACRFYAEHAARIVAPELVDGRNQRVVFDPLGVVLAVMPWNFPFWQVIRFAAPALAAGNVGLLKHASNVPQCALALEALFTRAGAPEGVFQTLLVGSERVAALIADDRVAAVTVTGSEGTGRAIAATAGQHLKKSVLELGGSDPFIVMPSADLTDAIATAVKARCINNGQSCIAAKRFLIDASIYDQFTDVFTETMASLRVGDPLDPETDLGPLATPGIREGLEDQVRRSISAGARLRLGGTRRPGPGNFYEPTVLTDIPRKAPAYDEELFGPVASLFKVQGAREAIDIANDTGFGLGASAWTGNPKEADLFAAELQAGTVFINAMVASDPRFPFGGIKRSGYGRELSHHGLREFVNVKTVRIL